jgi:galactitol-specific phosphotransferase system IIC component
MIDVYGQRLDAVSSLRLKPLMWQVLYGTAALTFFLVGLVSSADGKRNAIAWILLAVGLAAVLMLIVDLDRPHEGVLTVSQQALRALQQQFATPAP